MGLFWFALTLGNGRRRIFGSRVRTTPRLPSLTPGSTLWRTVVVQVTDRSTVVSRPTLVVSGLGEGRVVGAGPSRLPRPPSAPSSHPRCGPKDVQVLPTPSVAPSPGCGSLTPSEHLISVRLPIFGSFVRPRVLETFVYLSGLFFSRLLTPSLLVHGHSDRITAFCSLYLPGSSSFCSYYGQRL